MLYIFACYSTRTDAVPMQLRLSICLLHLVPWNFTHVLHIFARSSTRLCGHCSHGRASGLILRHGYSMPHIRTLGMKGRLFGFGTTGSICFSSCSTLPFHVATAINRLVSLCSYQVLADVYPPFWILHHVRCNLASAALHFISRFIIATCFSSLHGHPVVVGALSG